jgi:hypothetical protein
MNIVDVADTPNLLDYTQLDGLENVTSNLTDVQSLQILRIIVVKVDRSRLNEKAFTAISALFRFSDVWLKSAVDLLSLSRFYTYKLITAYLSTLQF